MTEKNITKKISDEIIAYKVIDRAKRFGTNYAIFCFEQSKTEFLDLISEIKELNQYFPIYSKNSVINYVEGSVGLMTFDSIANALDFLKSEDPLKRLMKNENIIIVKVSINKKNILPSPRYIRANCGGNILKLLHGDFLHKCVPEGTIFCKSLTVIE